MNKEAAADSEADVIEEPSYTEEELAILVPETIAKFINIKGTGKIGAANDCLKQLSSYDVNEGKRWEEISEYWDKINENDFLNLNSVPSGLSEEDNLCIVVMGYCLNPDGSMRDELVGRLETALKVANKYPNAYVLVTGGGTASNNPNATEADCMADWLIDNGLNEDRIIIENKSRTSAENALLSYYILDSDYPQIDSVVIVTSDYHVPLGCLLYNTQFMLKDSKIRVISNYGYISNNPHRFNLSDQAEWVINLYNIQTR